MKTRILHTRIWNDSFFSELTIEGKILFLFLITNEEIGLTGAYECSNRIISFNTGIPMANLEKTKQELTSKFVFIEDWVIVKNANKYTNYSSTLMMKKAYDKEYNFLPKQVQKHINIEGTDTVPSGYPDTSINNKSEIINNKSKIINNKTAEVKNMRAHLTEKLTVQSSGIHTPWQDEAFRLAEGLNIKLDDQSLKGRWLRFFKNCYEKKMRTRLQLAYTSLIDSPKFKTIPDPEGKMKYFFFVVQKQT